MGLFCFDYNMKNDEALFGVPRHLTAVSAAVVCQLTSQSPALTARASNTPAGAVFSLLCATRSARMEIPIVAKFSCVQHVKLHSDMALNTSPDVFVRTVGL